VPRQRREWTLLPNSGQVFFLDNFLKAFFRSLKPLVSRSPVFSTSQDIFSVELSTFILTGDQAFFIFPPRTGKERPIARKLL